MLIACCTALQIADFGLSRVMVETSISTGTYGTVTHMPPELLTSVRVKYAHTCHAVHSLPKLTGWCLTHLLPGSRNSRTALKQAGIYRFHPLQGRLSKAADTYAFGVLLWEMYTGQRPWAGMLQMQVLPAACLYINERLITRHNWQ